MPSISKSPRHPRPIRRLQAMRVALILTFHLIPAPSQDYHCYQSVAMPRNKELTPPMYSANFPYIPEH
jgi:hypothetical protein